LNKRYTLTEEDISAIRDLKKKKYGTWEWNYGYSPKYTYHDKTLTAGGFVEAYIDVKDGIINSIKLCGDFFSLRDVAEIETALTGVRHEREAVKHIIGRYNLNEFFLNVEEGQLLSCIGV